MGGERCIDMWLEVKVSKNPCGHPNHDRKSIIRTSAIQPLAPPAQPFECLALAEVIDRHAEGDRFVKTWTSFDALAAGELIAVRADGSEVRAPAAGYIVFPDSSARPGHEWFYLARASQRALL